MFAYFNRFEIQMTMKQAKSASHSGQCDDDVEILVNLRPIALQLEKIGPVLIAEELREYGAWDTEELADTEQNERRIVWIAAGNIVEEKRQRK